MKRYSRTKILLALLTTSTMLGALLAYRSNSDSSPELQAPAEYLGIWERTGYGEVVSITDQGGARYEFTRQTCILVEKLNNTRITELFSNTELLDDQYNRRVIPDEFQLFDWQIKKLQALPSVCRPEKLIETNTPTATFEHLWHTFSDYYAFFDERGVDWKKQYKLFRPKIIDNMSDDDLLDVLDSLLTPLDDGHIHLVSDDDDFYFSGIGKAEKYVMDTFPSQTEYEDEQDYADALGEQWQDIRSSYFSSERIGRAKGTSGAEVEWAITANNVGYLYIGAMEDLASNNQSNSGKDNLDAVNAIMEKVMAVLYKTDALIIDVRFNGGGYDSVSLAIANHFTDQSGIAYSKHDRNYAGSINAVDVFFSPVTDSPYLKPVAIIASQATASAAEVFLIMMSGLSHVTLMGENSEGILSDIPYRSLPKQWEIGVPNVVFVDSNGREYEVTGVPPEIEAPTNFEEIFEQKKDSAIEAALKVLGY